MDQGPLYAQFFLYAWLAVMALCAVGGALSVFGLLREGPSSGHGLLDRRDRVIEGQRVSYRVLRPGLHRWSVSVPTGALSLLSRREPEEALQTGHPDFDRHFVVGGPLTERSWLTPAVRQALLRLLPCSVRLEGGVLWADDRVERRSVACQIARTAGALAKVSADRRTRLQSWMEGAPVEVRDETWLGLAEEEPALAVELAPRLQQDAHESVRERARLLVQGQHGQCKGTVEQNLWVLLTLAGAGSAPAEELMISLLSELEDKALGPVVETLARVGTVAAVPALRARQSRLGLGRARLAHRFEQAVAAIQERAGGAPGGLAIASAPGEQGALSVAAEPGRVGLSRAGQTAQERR